MTILCIKIPLEYLILKKIHKNTNNITAVIEEEY